MTRTSCLGDCPMHILNIYLRRKAIILIFFCRFVVLPANNQPLLDYFWDISRDWESIKERQLCIWRLECYMQRFFYVTITESVIINWSMLVFSQTFILYRLSCLLIYGWHLLHITISNYFILIELWLLWDTLSRLSYKYSYFH